MIIFESILSTFKASIVSRGSCGGSIDWMEPKIKPPYKQIYLAQICETLCINNKALKCQELYFSYKFQVCLLATKPRLWTSVFWSVTASPTSSTQPKAKRRVLLISHKNILKIPEFHILDFLFGTHRPGLNFNSLTYYRVCHRFRLTKQDDYFLVNFDHICIKCHFLGSCGSGKWLKPKPNRVKQI